MSRPWWWYVLQIPGIVCFVLLYLLVIFAVMNWETYLFEKTPFLLGFLTFGIGWGFGSSLAEFINDFKARGDLFPRFPDQLCRLALGVSALIMIVFADWHIILVFIVSTLGYFLLWRLVPNEKKEGDTNAKSPRVDTAS